jgi:hypothetical protein
MAAKNYYNAYNVLNRLQPFTREIGFVTSTDEDYSDPTDELMLSGGGGSSKGTTSSGTGLGGGASTGKGGSSVPKGQMQFTMGKGGDFSGNVRANTRPAATTSPAPQTAPKAPTTPLPGQQQATISGSTGNFSGNIKTVPVTQTGPAPAPFQGAVIPKAGSVGGGTTPFAGTPDTMIPSNFQVVTPWDVAKATTAGAGKAALNVGKAGLKTATAPIRHPIRVGLPLAGTAIAAGVGLSELNDYETNQEYVDEMNSQGFTNLDENALNNFFVTFGDENVVDTNANVTPGPENFVVDESAGQVDITDIGAVGAGAGTIGEGSNVTGGGASTGGGGTTTGGTTTGDGEEVTIEDEEEEAVTDAFRQRFQVPSTNFSDLTPNAVYRQTYADILENLANQQVSARESYSNLFARAREASFRRSAAATNPFTGISGGQAVQGQQNLSAAEINELGRIAQTFNQTEREIESMRLAAPEEARRTAFDQYSMMQTQKNQEVQMIQNIIGILNTPNTDARTQDIFLRMLGLPEDVISEIRNRVQEGDQPGTIARIIDFFRNLPDFFSNLGN